MKAYHFGIVLLTLLLVSGCGLEGPVPSETKPAPPAPQVAQDTGSKPVAAPSHVELAPSAAAPAVAVAQPVPTGLAATSPLPARPRPSAANTAAPPGTVREQAHVGMGVRGRGYGNGLIAVAAASLWSVRERMGLLMIEDAVKKYKALNDGHGPKTTDEFMKKIVEENNIKLPLLPPGQTYEWDAEDETLMIRKPVDPNGP